MLFLISGAISAQSQKTAERNAILSMAGTYKVSFDFIETFAPDTLYKFYPKYHATASEMVIVTENSESKISLNHFLLVNDSVVVKHWRQDWIYENTEFLEYEGNNTWSKRIMSKEAVKGTWTQKVFQIDESPRYEAFGKWTRENNEWIWTGNTCNSPLPRRELLKREDYSVIKRRSRMVIGQDYWYLEQDNQKMKSDTLLCYEKGMEVFRRGTFDTSKIIKWWEKNEKIWLCIAAEWNLLISKNDTFKLSGALIASNYQQEVFRFAKQLSATETDDKKIRAAIREFITKNCKMS